MLILATAFTFKQLMSGFCLVLFLFLGAWMRSEARRS